MQRDWSKKFKFSRPIAKAVDLDRDLLACRNLKSNESNHLEDEFIHW
jgi:hypothetical protein